MPPTRPYRQSLSSGRLGLRDVPRRQQRPAGLLRMGSATQSQPPCKMPNQKWWLRSAALKPTKPSGDKPVVGLSGKDYLKQSFNQINSANVLHLRAAYFMENTLPQVGAIRKMGYAVGPLRPDLKIPMIATRDIGAAATEAMLHPSVRGKQIRELLGQRDLNYTEVVATIGRAIGTPDLKYMQLADDQVRAAMVQMGMSDQVARLLLEMATALNAGTMRALEPRTPQNTTPTT